jgi:hypothetical protein
MTKSPQIENFLENFSQTAFGRSRQECMNIGRCVTCGKMVKDNEFRDSLSIKEFGISGMCQDCQDSVFR